MVRAEIEADVRRVAERLRTLSEAQLTAEAAPYSTRAAGGRAVAQKLAEAAQAIEERHSGAEPQWRAVPELTAFAVGDQLAVMGHDLVVALDSVSPDEPVWARGTRRTAREVVADSAAQLAALRGVL